MESTFENLQVKERSTPKHSSKGSKGGSDKGELLCSEALQGATGQNPGSASLESLTEKIGTLGLQGHKKNNENLLTYSMEQSPSWEDNQFAASQEFPCILWNLNVHYCIHKCLPPVSILSQLNSVHTPHPTS
jgi:hypothetical protein